MNNMRRSLAPSILRTCNQGNVRVAQSKHETTATPQRPPLSQQRLEPPLTASSSCSSISSPSVGNYLGYKLKGIEQRSPNAPLFSKKIRTEATCNDVDDREVKCDEIFHESVKVTNMETKLVTSMGLGSSEVKMHELNHDDTIPKMSVQQPLGNRVECDGEAAKEKEAKKFPGLTETEEEKRQKDNLSQRTDAHLFKASIQQVADKVNCTASVVKEKQDDMRILCSTASLPIQPQADINNGGEMQETGEVHLKHKSGTIQEENTNDTASAYMKLSVILCNPTPRQTDILKELNDRSKSEKADVLASVHRRVCIHPDLVNPVSPITSTSQATESGKVYVLSLIDVADKVVLVRNNDSAQVLSNYGFDVVQLADISDERLQSKNIILFDIYSRDDIMRILSCMGSDHSIYILVTSGTIDEIDFLSSMGHLDLPDRPVASSSHILKSIEAMKKRWRADPDEEFSAIWLKLLEDGWNAEPGGGLVDYHYCPPGITSKSSKNGKIKGVKNVDFFTSKDRALEYIKQKRPRYIECARLEYGLYDLMLWSFVKGEAIKSIPGLENGGHDPTLCAFFLKISSH